MKFISSVSYSFLHNGEEFGCVVPRCGVRQAILSLRISILCVLRG